MNCNDIKIKLSAYVDGEASEMEKTEISKHINNCEKCKSVYETYVKLSQSVKSSEEMLPDDFKIKLPNEKRRIIRIFRGHEGLVSTVAAAVALIIFAGGISGDKYNAPLVSNSPQKAETYIIKTENSTEENTNIAEEVPDAKSAVKPRVDGNTKSTSQEEINDIPVKENNLIPDLGYTSSDIISHETETADKSLAQPEARAEETPISPEICEEDKFIPAQDDAIAVSDESEDVAPVSSGGGGGSSAAFEPANGISDEDYSYLAEEINSFEIPDKSEFSNEGVYHYLENKLEEIKVRATMLTPENAYGILEDFELLKTEINNAKK